MADQPTGKIADTTFATGPDDSVAVVDVYGNTTAVPQNAVPAITDTNIDLLQQAVTQVNNDTKVEPPKPVTTPPSQTAALSTVSKATSETPGALSVLGADIKHALMKAAGWTGGPATITLDSLGLPNGVNLTKTLLDQSPTLRVVYNGISQLRNEADLATSEGIASFMNVFTAGGAGAEIIDLKSKFAVLGTLLQKATGLQIPGVLDDIIHQFDASDIPDFLTGQILSAIENGALQLIAKILQHVPSKAILAIVPNAIPLLLKHYKLPYGVSFPTQNDYDALIAVLNAIDPNWGTYNRNGVIIPDLTPFTFASADSLAVLAIAPNVPVNVTVGTDWIPLALTTQGTQVNWNGGSPTYYVSSYKKPTFGIGDSRVLRLDNNGPAEATLGFAKIWWFRSTGAAQISYSSNYISPYEAQALIAPLFPEDDLVDLCKTQFPDVAITAAGIKDIIRRAL